LKAYEKLASILGVGMKVHTSATGTPFQRTKEVFNLYLNGFRNFYSRKKLYTFILKNPSVFFSELKKQKQRLSINDKTVGNGILVELTNEKY